MSCLFLTCFLSFVLLCSVLNDLVELVHSILHRFVLFNFVLLFYFVFLLCFVLFL